MLCMENSWTLREPNNQQALSGTLMPASTGDILPMCLKKLFVLVFVLEFDLDCLGMVIITVSLLLTTPQRQAKGRHKHSDD